MKFYTGTKNHTPQAILVSEFNSRKIQDGGGRHFEIHFNGHNSVTVERIRTKFGTETKGAFHQRRSAEPGSTLIVNLNQVQVMMCSTNVNLGSADVVQLNHDGYTSWTLIGPI